MPWSRMEGLAACAVALAEEDGAQMAGLRSVSGCAWACVKGALEESAGSACDAAVAVAAAWAASDAEVDVARLAHAMPVPYSRHAVRWNQPCQRP